MTKPPSLLFVTAHGLITSSWCVNSTSCTTFGFAISCANTVLEIATIANWRRHKRTKLIGPVMVRSVFIKNMRSADLLGSKLWQRRTELTIELHQSFLSRESAAYRAWIAVSVNSNASWLYD